MADLTAADAAEAKDDALAHYRRALHRAVRAYTVGGDKPTPETRDAILAEMERAYRLCPASGSAAANLLWLYDAAGRKDDARALAEQLEKSDRRVAFVDSWLAHRLNAAGEHRRALDLLAKTPWPPDTPLRIELTLENLRARLGLGDAAGILELFAKRIGACEHDEAKLHLLFHVDQVAMRLPPAAFKGIDAAAFETQLKKVATEARPFDAGLNIALAMFYERTGRPEDGMRTLLEAVELGADSMEWRHHFARAAWRVLATGGSGAVP